jgi:hypothetical protein
MRRYILLWILAVTPVHAQNGKWNVDPANDGQAQRQARIDACFRNAPQTSARDAWLDRCLRDAR